MNRSLKGGKVLQPKREAELCSTIAQTYIRKAQISLIIVRKLRRLGMLSMNCPVV